MEHMKWSNTASWLDCEIQLVAGRGKQKLIAVSAFSSATAANSPLGLNEIALASLKKNTNPNQNKDTHKTKPKTNKKHSVEEKCHEVIK